MSCGTSDGCTCESDELACEEGFDSDGFMTWTEYCYTKTGPEDWYCPVICNNDTAKKCGEGDFAECVPKSARKFAPRNSRCAGWTTMTRQATT
eukprot:Skav219191  [mRNA]  locus=scaffold648:723917:726221:- [translate_table: standard]